MQYKTLLGCAVYIDILKPPSLLSLSLQSSEVDTVSGIKHILKSSASLKSLAKQDPLLWPTVKMVLAKITDEDGEKSYQGAVLKRYSQSVVEDLKQNALDDLSRLDEKMRERLQWSDTSLLRCLVVFLDPQSWTKQSHFRHVSNSFDDDDEFDSEDDFSLVQVKESVDRIAEHFRLPLEAKGVLLASLLDEVEEAVQYARTYLDISGTDYRTIWYKLFSCPDAKKWPNFLSIAELAFSLPFSNGRVEQMFSSLKVVKTTRRANMEESTLNDLLELYIEGPTLQSFCPDRAVELWWSDSHRRVHQQPRKEYRPRTT